LSILTNGAIAEATAWTQCLSQEAICNVLYCG